MAAPAKENQLGVNESAPDHKPYIPDEVVVPEFTWPSVLMGAFLGIIFGASSLYLLLKVGMTVSASVPIAVLSITLFRAFSDAFGFRKTTILENNIVQTTGSAGESIAFGVGVTMPALMILGYEMEAIRVLTVASLGGLLGVLMMIPLRRGLIVKQHGILTYPEGTAYVLYIGAGAVAAGGIISVFASIPLIISSFRAGLKDFGVGKGEGRTPRTDRDMPMKWVLLGSIILVSLIWFSPMLNVNLVGA